jgi:hypothetical protein
MLYNLDEILKIKKEYTKIKIKDRKLVSPSEEYKDALKSINNILKMYKYTNDNKLQNFQITLNNYQFYIKLDLKNAFFSIDKAKLHYLIEDINGCYENFIPVDKFTEFIKFVTVDNVLYPGLPTSSYFFDLYMQKYILPKLYEITKNKIIIYRYVDDFIFVPKTHVVSNKDALKKTLRALKYTIREAGFKINKKKTRIVDVKKNPSIILGVSYKDYVKFGIRSSKKNRMRERVLWYNYINHKTDKNLEKLRGFYSFFPMSNQERTFDYLSMIDKYESLFL